ncbi:MAG: hypothetical protein ABI566_00475 [Pseudolysinimonas sp.]
MSSRVLIAVPVLVVALLSGCASGPAEPESWYTPGALKPGTSSPTPSAVAEAPVAAAPAPPPAAAPAPAPASVDYVGPVTARWGGCFSRLGVGDIYYDSTLGVVTAAWNGGVLTWNVDAVNRSGVPADQGSVDALAGC